MAAGCGETSPVGGGAAPRARAALGQAAQAVVSAQACVALQPPRRARCSVFDTQLGSPRAAATQNFGARQNINAGTLGRARAPGAAPVRPERDPVGADTNITNANLVLAQASIAHTGPATINVHRVTSPVERGARSPGRASRGGFDPTVWSQLQQRRASSRASTITALVQAWVRGTYPNDGLLLESPSQPRPTSGRASTRTVGSAAQRSTSASRSPATPASPTATTTALDGCEADTTTSAANCGGCGNACSVPNAAPACVGSACAVGACNLGFADCNARRGRRLRDAAHHQRQLRRLRRRLRAAQRGLELRHAAPAR